MSHYALSVTSDLDGYRALACAVVVQAARDASGGDKRAAAWLVSEGPDWLDALGINKDSDDVRKLLKCGKLRRNLYKQQANLIIGGRAKT